MASSWACGACAYADNDGDECDSCGEARAAAAGAPAGNLKPLVVVALVLSLAPVPGKDKLRVATLDVGDGAAAPVVVVTSAPNVAVGARVVVALPGATVRGADGDVDVKAATVGGVKSSGMLCDAPMLGWVGGGAGNAALCGAESALGSAPPAARPRLG
jgi:tRNA-binding EMAP/Myf-like protein